MVIGFRLLLQADKLIADRFNLANPIWSMKVSKPATGGNQSRARGSVQRRGTLFHRCWQGRGSCASREAIRAVHMNGPAPSGDFWFLLVRASKCWNSPMQAGKLGRSGTRRRQGIGRDCFFGFRLLAQADRKRNSPKAGNMGRSGFFLILDFRLCFKLADS